MFTYIFTDRTGHQVIDQREFEFGDQALAHRAKLERDTSKTVIAWAHMGGDNPALHA